MENFIKSLKPSSKILLFILLPLACLGFIPFPSIIKNIICVVFLIGTIAMFLCSVYELLQQQKENLKEDKSIAKEIKNNIGDNIKKFRK